MPWKASDASKKTKLADTPSKKKQWKAIANGALNSGKSDATAIKMANGVIKKGSK